MKPINAILAVLALVISGCSTAVSPQKSTSIDPQKTGVVLATLECSGAPEDVATRGIEFVVEPLDSPYYPTKYASITSAENLCVLEMPPGRYRIANWYYTSFYDYQETAVNGFEFEVKPGRVIYLGHLQARFSIVKNEKGERMYVRVRPILENHFDQAVPEFWQRYPALAELPVYDVAPQEFAFYPTTIARRDYRPIDNGQYQPYFPSPPASEPRFLSQH